MIKDKACNFSTSVEEKRTLEFLFNYTFWFNSPWWKKLKKIDMKLITLLIYSLSCIQFITYWTQIISNEIFGTTIYHKINKRAKINRLVIGNQLNKDILLIDHFNKKNTLWSLFYGLRVCLCVFYSLFNGSLFKHFPHIICFSVLRHTT